MKAWIMELCPEIQEWQAELIAEEAAKSDTALLRQALKALNYVGVDPIDREEWEETEAIITALRERLGEVK